jgi:toxin-antitoxin system PIN domain toxin
VIAVDTNVLIYAHRGESQLHDLALARLVELAEASTPWSLPVFCLAEFVRVVTHLRVFAPPSDMESALEFLGRVLDSPSLRVLLPGERFPSMFEETCRSAGARGNLAFDAQIAAVCAEQGVDRLLTADRDFARFRGITVEPLEC